MLASQIPGKDIRGKLVDAFQKWLVIPHDKVMWQSMSGGGGKIVVVFY